MRTNTHGNKMRKKIKNIVDHAEVSEKSNERYLIHQVKQLGGLCLKYSSSNEVGYPDRLVLLPGGVMFWVELKSKGEKPTLLQSLRHDTLRSLGCLVFVADSKNDIDDILFKTTFNAFQTLRLSKDGC